ncbi:MAG: exopolyphosphatase [Betaproteobacteria bacterium]|nr:exopolyphosphatase [Betaproteobacteria bacterium]
MPHHTLAAIDLGSNSFHLQIARVINDQLYPLDSLKETVRLGAGISADKNIDAKTAARALNTLRLFAERIRALPHDAVRVVGTNAFRVAKNADAFVREAETVLGFPIEIIAGREEARLIYVGVAHSLPLSPHKRLVIDIGGGSTEFIIGQRLTPCLLESLYMGCVSYSERFFPQGEIDKKRFKEAGLAAKEQIEPISAHYHNEGWHEAVGSSGTARALANILEESGVSKQGISRAGLEWLREKALKAGNFKNLNLPGIKSDRIPVLPGGLAIMLSIFEALDLTHMTVADTALRDGVLYDLLGRTLHEDIRNVTVTEIAKRYQVDLQQAQRVETLALHLFDQIQQEAESESAFQRRQELQWAGHLHELGIAIAQAGLHKHTAYIIANADMPGFSKREQSRLAALLLAQRGKLGKIKPEWLADPGFITSALSLRLAVLLARSRRDIDARLFSLAREGKGFALAVDGHWLSQHDLTDYELRQEIAEWENQGVTIRLSGMSK